MAYSVILWCGCTVDVSCDATTGIAQSRIIGRRGTVCTVRRHEVGTRVWLWELLPDSSRRLRAGWPAAGSVLAGESGEPSDRQVVWRLRRGNDLAWCVLQPVGDRVELHITMAHDVVMSQRCNGLAQASATSTLWRSALVERGWVDAHVPAVKPKPDRRALDRGSFEQDERFSRFS